MIFAFSFIGKYCGYLHLCFGRGLTDDVSEKMLLSAALATIFLLPPSLGLHIQGYVDLNFEENKTSSEGVDGIDCINKVLWDNCNCSCPVWTVKLVGKSAIVLVGNLTLIPVGIPAVTYVYP